MLCEVEFVKKNIFIMLCHPSCGPVRSAGGIMFSSCLCMCAFMCWHGHFSTGLPSTSVV